MTDSESRDGALRVRVRASAEDVAVGLLASISWGAVTVARLRGSSSLPALSIAALGCASSSGVPIVVVARALRSNRALGRSIGLAALVSLVPVALLASAIKTKTHHRALGAVTFAVIATAIVGALELLLRSNVRGDAPRGVARRLGRIVLALVAAASAAWIVVTLLGAAPSGPLRDGLAAVILLGAATVVPHFTLPKGVRRVAPGLFVFVALVGASVALRNASVLAVLCDRAPLTLGLPGIFACP